MVALRSANKIPGAPTTASESPATIAYKCAKVCIVAAYSESAHFSLQAARILICVIDDVAMAVAHLHCSGVLWALLVVL
jgi:hypothetical protein